VGLNHLASAGLRPQMFIQRSTLCPAHRDRCGAHTRTRTGIGARTSRVCAQETLRTRCRSVTSALPIELLPEVGETGLEPATSRSLFEELSELRTSVSMKLWDVENQRLRESPRAIPLRDCGRWGRSCDGGAHQDSNLEVTLGLCTDVCEVVGHREQVGGAIGWRAALAPRPPYGRRQESNLGLPISSGKNSPPAHRCL
jgi:hypothetical protein